MDEGIITTEYQVSLTEGEIYGMIHCMWDKLVKNIRSYVSHYGVLEPVDFDWIPQLDGMEKLTEAIGKPNLYNNLITESETPPLYSECKICSAKTKRLFNFLFLDPIPICNECANAIMLQQGKFLVENSNNG